MTFFIWFSNDFYNKMYFPSVKFITADHSNSGLTRRWIELHNNYNQARGIANVHNVKHKSKTINTLVHYKAWLEYNAIRRVKCMNKYIQ